MVGSLGIAAGTALLGLVAGSFISVLVKRIGTGRTVVWGRSSCPNCHRTLRWPELIPLLSFFLQRGRCRSCGRSISFFYPLVEALAAVIFTGIGLGLAGGFIPPPPFAFHGADGALTPLAERAVWFFYYAFFAGSAIAVSFYDIEHLVIPPVIIWPLFALGVTAEIIGIVRGAPLLPVFVSAVGTFFFFWSLWFFSGGRAMGRGDANVALVIVLALGPGIGLLGVLMAFWFGAAYGIVLILARVYTLKSRVPFAPFLFAGSLAALATSNAFSLFYPFFYVF